MGGYKPDLLNELGRAELLEAARRINGTFNSSGIDLRNVQGKAILWLDSSLGVGTTPTLDVAVQDSDDDGDADAYVAVAAAALTDNAGDAATFAQVTAAANNGLQELGLNCTRVKRYVRVVVTIASAAGQGFDSAMGIIAKSRPEALDRDLS